MNGIASKLKSTDRECCSKESLFKTCPNVDSNLEVRSSPSMHHPDCRMEGGITVATMDEYLSSVNIMYSRYNTTIVSPTSIAFYKMRQMCI